MGVKKMARPINRGAKSKGEMKRERLITLGSSFVMKMLKEGNERAFIKHKTDPRDQNERNSGTRRKLKTQPRFVFSSLPSITP
jgi:hypothetical protein